MIEGPAIEVARVEWVADPGDARLRLRELGLGALGVLLPADQGLAHETAGLSEVGQPVGRGPREPSESFGHLATSAVSEHGHPIRFSTGDGAVLELGLLLADQLLRLELTLAHDPPLVPLPCLARQGLDRYHPPV
jgi:hypothetical protein